MTSASSSSAMREILGDDFVMKNSRGSTEKGSQFHLAGKHVAIYFSAHWCPPCRQFTPMLRRTYQRMKEDGKAFEVIFVSSDKDERQFNEYYSEMPWMAIPFDDTSRRQSLARRFNVSGIPALVLLSPTGEVLNTNARADVASDPHGDRFPWIGGSQSSLANGLSMQKVAILTAIAWVVFAIIIPYLQRHGYLTNDEVA
uniref:Thioredoxin domain-containing protein n=1 Tax=Polytomella parva TaxID=51329 RepID=A0A7S0UU34_9CHLO|mmetsp:Transcript_17927/g.32727  ORF Transcript_17927/g.32727 Transcript_17927/m.32727 type:complete len:199 (+) Transcript_17927:109-705(+)|eukprot:CAMPEP_0175078692 /NCGR_PEP_ID=MMETSP0052_2-20121109/24304_1 /TAXON_ID=51329 ORGANISM="Polytomella parva, Strain SAG 63-3" /NCGR_SAMPLE_ID=MMETSP0052_2 /ASSEMBLY_ACC=CAM_ASM_000194 /LENGTH=198 /DNA_ID=CAMNT_0016348731 /DNA_START=108 /DNA_END=704 /DNA_ORIENTATION=-